MTVLIQIISSKIRKFLFIKNKWMENDNKKDYFNHY